MMTLPDDIASAVYPYRQLLVAFSGGLDSTVLLHWLMLWRENTPDVELRAIHINHGLSAHASDWVAHCQSLCADWNIPLLIERVALADEGLGVEGQARKARYEVLNKTLLPGEALVTAQHLDDQSETFMLALKRGSGPAGLSAMPARAAFASTQLLRPLLGETRASLLRWAQTHGLHWIEDESNQDDSYDRNFLRLRVLPMIAQRWPHFAGAVARSAALCAEQESLLDELLSDDLSAVMADNGTLAIAPLVAMSAQHRAALLRRWLAAHGAPMPSRTMLNCIWNEVAQAREDACPCLYLNGYVVRRFRGQLWWVVKRPSLRETIVDWPDARNAVLTLPQDAGHVYLTEPGNIRLPLPNEAVSIRFKATGMLHIVGRRGGRRLKKIWQEYNVPPWLRDAMPLLFYGQKLIAAAGGLFITREGWAEKGVRLEWKA